MKKTIFLSVLCFFGLIFSSCSKVENVAQVNSFENGVAPRMALAKSAAKSVANTSFAMADMAVAEEAAFDDDSDSGSSSNYERKLIKNGNVSVEVQNLSQAEEAVENWIKQFKGYVSYSNNSQKNAHFTVKVPCESFDSAMEAAGNLGTLLNRSVSTQDVSEQFYDLQTRLETRKVLRQKLNGYLSQAANMTDMLKIEKELNSVQTEIESMEGRLKRLSSQIEFSTINVDISLPYATTEHGFEFPSFSNGVRKFFANLIAFYGKYLVAIFYIILCGIGIIAALALFYWLLLGKIGLLRKLFNKIRK